MSLHPRGEQAAVDGVVVYDEGLSDVQALVILDRILDRGGGLDVWRYSVFGLGASQGEGGRRVEPDSGAEFAGRVLWGAP